MRIISRKEFLDLPPGVIYSEYVPEFTSGLFRKGRTLSKMDELGPGTAGDYYEVSLEPCIVDGGYPVLDAPDVTSRNGAFVYDQQYIVYEQVDLERLRMAIATAVPAELKDGF